VEQSRAEAKWGLAFGEHTCALFESCGAYVVGTEEGEEDEDSADIKNVFSWFCR